MIPALRVRQEIQEVPRRREIGHRAVSGTTQAPLELDRLTGPEQIEIQIHDRLRRTSVRISTCATAS